MNNFTPAIALIRQAKNILITSHTRPDGDAIGSMVALKQTITKNCNAENIDLLLLSKPGDVYSFMAQDYLLWDQDIKQTAELDNYDLIIIVDTSAMRQLPGIDQYLLERTEKGQMPILILDHHIANDHIGTCRIIDSSCGAAGQIVYQLIDMANWHIDALAANALFMAIATDTGWFRFQNTDSQILFVAGDLIACGAEPDILYQNLFLNNPPEKLALLTATLETLQLHHNNQIATIYITVDMLKKTGAKRSLIENIVNEPMQIGSVIACGLFVELENGDIRGSLRSKNIIDVNAIANKFNGGGHIRAAGLTVTDSDIIAVRDAVANAMISALTNSV